MNLKSKNFNLYLRGCVGELEEQFILYEIHVDMVNCHLEVGDKIACFHEYPITIEEAIEDIKQRRARIASVRDVLLERYPEAKDMITEQRILDL